MTKHTPPLDTQAREEHTDRVAAVGGSGVPRALGVPSHAVKRGRLPKALTEARLRRILRKVVVGVPPERAAVAAGVPKRTWQHWLEKGRRPDAVEPYASVASRLETALAVYHESRVQVIHEGALKDPRIAQWELERRFPEDWADPSRGGVTINLGLILQSPEWMHLRDGLLAVLAPHAAALEDVRGFLAGGAVVDGSAVEVAELAA